MNRLILWAIVVALVVAYGVVGCIDREAEEATWPDYAALQRMRDLADSEK